MSEPNLTQTIQREFLNMALRPRNMTFYSVRTTILRSVKEQTASFYGSVLDVGCGVMPYRKIIETTPAVDSYVGMDLNDSGVYRQVVPDMVWDGVRIPADDSSFDCVIATEFLEHLADPTVTLTEIARVMRPGGRLFATVPFLWNLHEIPHDEYRYTPFSLQRHFTEAGFREITIKPLGGWNIAFAQMMGLWIGFAPMHRVFRGLLRILVFPAYAGLVLTDRVPDSFDASERSMFNGLSVMALKEDPS